MGVACEGQGTPLERICAAVVTSGRGMAGRAGGAIAVVGDGEAGPAKQSTAAAVAGGRRGGKATAVKADTAGCGDVVGRRLGEAAQPSDVTVVLGEQLKRVAREAVVAAIGTRVAGSESVAVAHRSNSAAALDGWRGRRGGDAAGGGNCGGRMYRRQISSRGNPAGVSCGDERRATKRGDAGTDDGMQPVGEEELGNGNRRRPRL